MSEYRKVTIPACVEHGGFYSITVTLPWKCIECGGPRGEPYKSLSYDGSLRLGVDNWINPCGHIEKYQAVREWMSRHRYQPFAGGFAARAPDPDPKCSEQFGEPGPTYAMSADAEKRNRVWNAIADQRPEWTA